MKSLNYDAFSGSGGVTSVMSPTLSKDKFDLISQKELAIIPESTERDKTARTGEQVLQLLPQKELVYSTIDKHTDRTKDKSTARESKATSKKK